MEYSEMLKEILKSSHWTQEQLAAKLGVSFATVNSWLNERTKPQRSLIPMIERLYLAQDVTKEPEPVYITLINARDAQVGDYVELMKDLDNSYDDEAIRAEVARSAEEPEIVKPMEGNYAEAIFYEDDDEDDDGGVYGDEDDDEPLDFAGPYEYEPYRSPYDYLNSQMYVANSVSTVAQGTRSAGRIYDKFERRARAQVIFKLRKCAIARIVSWNAD